MQGCVSHNIQEECEGAQMDLLTLTCIECCWQSLNKSILLHHWSDTNQTDRWRIEGFDGIDCTMVLQGKDNADKNENQR